MIIDISKNGQIYTEYCEKVTRYIRGKIANQSDVEDVVSDVFLKVYGNLQTFDETKASLSTWIYHITQNTVTDYYRKRRVLGEIPENITGDESIDDGLINEEMLDCLADGLESLDERSRNLIILHYYSGMKLKDIADRMDISYIYAKVLHKKALEELKNYF